MVLDEGMKDFIIDIAAIDEKDRNLFLPHWFNDEGGRRSRKTSPNWSQKAPYSTAKQGFSLSGKKWEQGFVG